MKIIQLTANRMRNLRDVSIDTSPEVNILYGRNGQGKTSLLEAVYLFSTGQSFRTRQISEIIQFDQPSASSSVTFLEQNRSRTAVLTLERSPQRKRFLVDDIARKPGEEAFHLPMVLFRPEDLELVKSGPTERRALLDGLLWQLSPRYAKYAAEYNRCLMQRNALLKRGSRDLNLLDVLDAALARLGVYLTTERYALCETLSPAAAALYAGISGGSETLSVTYHSTVFADPPKDRQTAELWYYDLLCKKREQDAAAGFTTHGAHRDDLLLDLDGRPARAFGSQGQQRTAAIACRLASTDILRDTLGVYPVVLLDDVFSELDPTRCQFILDTVTRCQIFLTGCDENALQKLAPKTREVFRFCVEGGRAERK